jgi:FtsZ-binding cell division protein ZapB
MANGDQPATRQDIEQLRSETHQGMEQLRTEMEQLRSETHQGLGQLRSDLEQQRSEFHHEFDDLKETMRDSQTEILRAFYGYTQTTDAKLKETEASDIGLRQRLTAVEERLLEVEKRLNFPPAA